MVSLLMQAMQQYFDKHGPHTCSWPFLLAVLSRLICFINGLLILAVAMQYANSDRDKQPTGTFSKADCYMAPFVGHSTVYHRRQAFVDQKPLYLCLILLTRSLLPARRPNSL